MIKTKEKLINNNADGNPLGYEKIGKLIASYAIPSIIAMLVNALYNIVDQIFIGYNVGYLGNAATTIAFPIITIGLSISLMFGNGCAAYVSLKLGQNDVERVDEALGASTALAVIISISFAFLSFIFIKPFLNLLGATPKIYDYCYDYVSIILIGQPFIIICTLFANVIRSDGNPRYSMACVLVGAGLNTALDPVLINGFNMSVAGAAYATVISQIVSFIFAAVYFKHRSKYVFLHIQSMRFNGRITQSIMALGFSSFINQVAFTFVNIIMNNLLRYYGAQSVYGSEIPLSAMGIVFKVNGIMISIILGIAIGAQPILGYNYGAKNYERVKKTYTKSVLIATIVAIISWIITMTIPDKLVMAFGDNSPEFVEFGAICFRTFLMLVCMAGFHIVSANYFQATGRPVVAAFLSMCRQIIILMPLMLLLSKMLGLMGVLYSCPVADTITTIITAVFIIIEMKKLNKLQKNKPVLKPA